MGGLLVVTESLWVACQLSLTESLRVARSVVTESLWVARSVSLSHYGCPGHFGHRGRSASMKRNKRDFYWAIQAGLLTPLTFTRHRLSPLPAFTSGAYFLHNGKR